MAEPTIDESLNFEVIYDPSVNRVTICQLEARAEAWWNTHQPQIVALMNGLAEESAGRMTVPLLKEIQKRFTVLVAETSGKPVRCGLRSGTITTKDPRRIAAIARHGLELARQSSEQLMSPHRN